MTDQTVPNVTDDDRKLAREWAEFIESDVTGLSSRRKRSAARVILNDVPAPAPPTLADMTREERAACRWMQADVKDRGGRYVIATPSDRNGLAGLVSADGGIEWTYPERITPRPDLPRLEWPSDKKADDVPPVKVGDVIESADDPRLDALPAGSILLDLYGEKVEKISDEAPRWTGPGCFPYAEEGTAYGPWKVLHVGQEADQ